VNTNEHDGPSAIGADGLLTPAEGAAFLGIGRTTLYSLMERGELTYRMVGRARRIPKRALAEYADSELRRQSVG
jgi:excisionase family DNA binding protein